MAEPQITINVTNTVVGWSYLEDYQNLANPNIYIVPTYLMQLKFGNLVIGEYEVIRFGVADRIRNKKNKQGPYDPYAFGIQNRNSYNLEWDADYGLTSCPEAPSKGWRIKDPWKNKLVHAGPTAPRSEEPPERTFFGAAGCIEVCGPGKWQDLNDRILKASHLTGDRDKIFRELAATGRIRITFEQVKGPSRLYDVDTGVTAFQQDYPEAFPPLFEYPPQETPPTKPSDVLKEFLRSINPLSCDLVGSAHACEGLESYCDAGALKGPLAAGEKQRTDPLVVDLDGDGIQTTLEGRSWAAGRAFFDHNADGFAERTGWVSGSDGLLVMDRNGDGIINNGRELFGSGTALNAGRAATTGFQALADLDSNHDGKIDANDVAFPQLQIWKDPDEDGFSFPSELHTLAELGIASISLTPTAPGSGKDAQGNTQDRVGSFTWADGSTGQIAEYTFATNTAYSIATEWVDVPDDIAALPDLPGYVKISHMPQEIVQQRRTIR